MLRRIDNFFFYVDQLWPEKGGFAIGDLEEVYDPILWGGGRGGGGSRRLLQIGILKFYFFVKIRIGYNSAKKRQKSTNTYELNPPSPTNNQKPPQEFWNLK